MELNHSADPSTISGDAAAAAAAAAATTSNNKYRSWAAQCYAALATNLLKYAYGSFLGFTTVMLAEFYPMIDKDDASVKISLAEFTWFGSTCFMIPVGSLLVGLLAQNIGSRLTLLVAAIAFVAAWTTFYLAASSRMFLLGQAIAGLFVAVALGPGATYVVEISQTHLRSILMASTNLSVMVGVFLTVLSNNFLHWRSIALVNLAFPVLGFLAVSSIPESPHWLASKGRYREAEASLSWLRGWARPSDTRAEFLALKDGYAKRSTTTAKSQSRLRESAYCRGSFCLPLASVCYMFAVHSCTGYSALHAFCIVIFEAIGAPIDGRAAASVFDAVRILGAIVCLLAVRYTGKRRLMIASLLSAGLSYAAIATLLLLRRRHELMGERLQWLAAVAMIFSAFVTSAGIDKIVFMLNAELFPTASRNLGAGIGIFVHSVCCAATNKLFLYVLQAIDLAGVFGIFAAACFLACASFYFIFPETEGRTLREIEEHYDGTNSLTRRRARGAS